MTRIIRENRDEEADLNTRRALVGAESDQLGASRVVRPYYPRHLPAGDPASEGGTRVAFSELTTELQARIESQEAKWGAPVQTIQNLRDVPPDAREDKQLRLVEDAGAVYRFDTADTTTPDDGDLVIAPTDPSTPNGRWFRTLITPAEFAAHVADASAHHTRYTDAEARAAQPDASETVKGIIEIATQAETNAGTDDTRAITPLKISGLIRLPRYALEFSSVLGVPNAGTRFLDRAGVACTSVPVLLPAAAVLTGLTVVVNTADATRDYVAEVVSDPAGTPVLIGSGIALPAGTTSASRRDLSAAIGPGVLWGVRVRKTNAVVGPSSFIDVRVEVEVEIP